MQKVSCRCRIRDYLCDKSIQPDIVISQQFNILEAGATGKNIIGHIVEVIVSLARL